MPFVCGDLTGKFGLCGPLSKDPAVHIDFVHIDFVYLPRLDHEHSSLLHDSSSLHMQLLAASSCSCFGLQMTCPTCIIQICFWMLSDATSLSEQKTRSFDCFLLVMAMLHNDNLERLQAASSARCPAPCQYVHFVVRAASWRAFSRPLLIFQICHDALGTSLTDSLQVQ